MMTEQRMARRRILVIANPTAGGARSTLLGEIVERLQEVGCNVQVRETATVADLERLLGEGGGHDVDAVAIAGGDGTINRVLNALPDGAPPIAVLPLGTVNLLAREIGLPTSTAGIAETTAFGPSRPISVGEINGQRFAIVASVGLDAEVVDHVNLNLKHHIGKWAYLYETLKQVTLCPPAAFRFRLNGREHRAHGIVIANGRHYAGAYVTSPKAHLEKHSFEVCQLTRPGRLAALRYLTSLATGRFAQRADVRIDEVTDLQILEPEGAPVQADGDVLCRLPATLRVLPEAARLIFPTSPEGQPLQDGQRPDRSTSDRGPSIMRNAWIGPRRLTVRPLS